MEVQHDNDDDDGLDGRVQLYRMRWTLFSVRERVASVELYLSHHEGLSRHGAPALAWGAFRAAFGTALDLGGMPAATWEASVAKRVCLQRVIVRLVERAVDADHLVIGPMLAEAVAAERRHWPGTAHLAEILAEADNSRAGPIALTSRGQPWTESRFRASWRTLRVALEKQGRIGTGLTFHGLRHTVATILRQAGVDPRLIADSLGQKTEGMALHYSREADLSATMKGVGKVFEAAEVKVRAARNPVNPISGSVKPNVVSKRYHSESKELLVAGGRYILSPPTDGPAFGFECAVA